MRFLTASGLVLAAFLAGASAHAPAYAQEKSPASGPFQAVGLWRFFHSDGKPFTARLMADQTAATDWGGGEHGIWRWEGKRVHVYYTDGWDDVLYARGKGFRKAGYAPGDSRCAKPSNDTKAEFLSKDPKASP